MSDERKSEIPVFSEEERRRHLLSFGRDMYDNDVGLLVQAELVRCYEAVLGGALKRTPLALLPIPRADRYYHPETLTSALTAITSSNFLSSPEWENLNIDDLKQPLFVAGSKLTVMFLENMIKSKFSGEMPPNLQDCQLMLKKMEELGFIEGDYNHDSAIEKLMGDWNNYDITTASIGKRLFRAGAKNIHFPKKSAILKELSDQELRQFYLFNVLKLSIMFQLISEGLKILETTPGQVDNIYSPPLPQWPKFSQAYEICQTITHDANSGV